MVQYEEKVRFHPHVCLIALAGDGITSSLRLCMYTYVVGSYKRVWIYNESDGSVMWH